VQPHVLFSCVWRLANTEVAIYARYSFQISVRFSFTVFFDMSYEGDYIEFKADDELETEAERLERVRERERLTKSSGGVREIIRPRLEMR
jgi:hypothetical protein